MTTTTTASSTAAAALPTGYRFYPTEEELIGFYLQNKLDGRREDMDFVIPVVDVYFFNPWQLPPMSGEPCRRDGEQCFFFCPRQEREAQGGRPTRTTPTGYWKATGSPSLVFSSSTSRALGVKRTMVFYQGRAPTGTKTKWKMNEYRAIAAADGASAARDGVSSTTAPTLRGEFSLCRLYTRSGCIRAFDRRPFAAADIGGRETMIPAAETAPSSSAPPAAAAAASAKRSLSRECSSSDGSGPRASARQRVDDDHRPRSIAVEDDDQCDPFDPNWFWN